MAKSFFQDIEPIPVDETFRLLDQFNSDTSPNKVNLGIGGNYCAIPKSTAFVHMYIWILSFLYKQIYVIMQ